jgi:hypothetical protein
MAFFVEFYKKKTSSASTLEQLFYSPSVMKINNANSTI